MEGLGRQTSCCGEHERSTDFDVGAALGEGPKEGASQQATRHKAAEDRPKGHRPCLGFRV